MTKKLPLLLLGGLLFSGFAQAAPVIYTFTGSATAVDDFEGVIADIYPGVDFVGMPIEYVISVDTDLQGSATTYEGDIEVNEDFIDPGVFSFDSSFAELVSGSLVEQNNGYFANFDPEGYAQINWASTVIGTDPFQMDSFIDVGSDDDLLSIRSSFPAVNTTFSEWAIGLQFSGFERIFAPDRPIFGQVITDLVLTDISVSAVPLPPAILLFGSALLGLVTAARRRKAA